jgi:hypothetical protein
MNMASPFIGTYTSFSGADLVVNFGPTVIGELQQISYAVQREKVPVFTLGSPNPRSFSRGKRGIAGSMVFAAFDRDALLEEMKNIWDLIAPKDGKMFTAAGNIAVGKSEDFSAAMDLVSWNKKATASAQALYTSASNFSLLPSAVQTAITALKDALSAEQVKEALLNGGITGAATAIAGLAAGATASQIIVAVTAISSTAIVGAVLLNYAINVYNATNSNALNTGYGFAGRGAITANNTTNTTPPGFTRIGKDNIQYLDQLPPFDVTLTFANEYGQAAFQKIYDVEILNEASGVSVDSVVMERNYTWVGRNLSPLYKGIYQRDSNGIIQPIDQARNL